MHANIITASYGACCFVDKVKGVKFSWHKKCKNVLKSFDFIYLRLRYILFPWR